MSVFFTTVGFTQQVYQSNMLKVLLYGDIELLEQ